MHHIRLEHTATPASEEVINRERPSALPDPVDEGSLPKVLSYKSNTSLIRPSHPGRWTAQKHGPGKQHMFGKVRGFVVVQWMMVVTHNTIVDSEYGMRMTWLRRGERSNIVDGMSSSGRRASFNLCEEGLSAKLTSIVRIIDPSRWISA